MSMMSLATEDAVGRAPAPGPARTMRPEKSPSTATQFKAPSTPARVLDLGIMVGETREWETVEYVADAVTEGRRKALIILSHIPSEQAGMEECSLWLKSFLKNIPVEFVAASEPFWAPK